MSRRWIREIKPILETNPSLETVNALAIAFLNLGYNTILPHVFNYIDSKGWTLSGSILNAMCCSDSCYEYGYVFDRLHKYRLPVDFQCEAHGNTLLWGARSAKSFKALINKGVDLNHVNKNNETVLWSIAKSKGYGVDLVIRKLKRAVFDGYTQLNRKDNNGETIFFHIGQICSKPFTLATPEILLEPNNHGQLSIHKNITTKCFDNFGNFGEWEYKKFTEFLESYTDICRYILRVPYNGSNCVDMAIHRLVKKSGGKNITNFLLFAAHKDHVALLNSTALPTVKFKVLALKTTLLMLLFKKYDTYKPLIDKVPSALLNPGDPSKDIYFQAVENRVFAT